MLFRSESRKYPYRTIIVPFSQVRELVEQRADEFKLCPAYDDDGSQMMLLCIPEEDFIESCDAMVFETGYSGEVTVKQIRESKWEQEVFGNVH